MTLGIFNTLTRKKDELHPKDGKTFGMYCCGPTVYGPAHIGNFRTFCAQDVLRRTLELTGIKVMHVRNITDVDDKTIRESRKLGQTLTEFTRRWEDKFHKDCDALNLLKPQVEPRATEHIKEQLDMIIKLVEKGYAYATADGSVYFKIAADLDYGKLSGLEVKNLETQTVNSAGDANNADEYARENVSDFALWKGRKPEDGDNFWKSPWGEGRPGWHIECSAMAQKYLGDSFDLHGGGIDLCFPHHENEIAQSESATGVSPCVRYWFHSAHLMVEGEKMSKSLGNLYTLDDLTAKGYSPNQIRFTLISGHYRQQLNFTFKGLEDAKSAIAKLEKSTLQTLQNLGISEAEFKTFIAPKANFENSVFEAAFAAMCDDLNVPKALGEIFSAFAKSKETPLTKADLEALGGLLYALGLKLFEREEKTEIEIPAEVTELAQKRLEAKQAKDYALADTLRKQAADLGWIITDTKTGFEIKKA